MLLKLYGGQQFNPLVYSPALWLDAADASTLFQDRTGASASTPVASNADPVGTTKDKSGNARHVTAASDAARPVYAAAAQNGRSVVTFDGIDDLLQTASNFGTNAGLSGNPAFTVFWVAKKTLATAGHVLGWGDMATTLGGAGFVDNNTIKLWGYAGGSSYIHTGVPNNTWVVQSYRKTPGAIDTTSTMRMNGTSAAAGSGHSSNTPNISGSYPLSVGRWGTFITYYLQGSMAEILIYPSALTDAQVSAVERYLGNKWGISVA